MIQEAESSRVLTIENAHVPECGPPPAIYHRAEDNLYVGYFANRYGEQWVVLIDPAAKMGVLRGGDIGWAEEVPLKDGHMGGDLILGTDERQWLDACWRAACGEPLAS